MSSNMSPEMAKEIGQLSANVQNLTDVVSQLREEIRQNEALSQENRRRLYDRVEKISDRLDEVERDQADISSAITDDIMPAVRKIGKWEQRGIGALAATGMVSAGASAAVVTFWENILKVLRLG